MVALYILTAISEKRF